MQRNAWLEGRLAIVARIAKPVSHGHSSVCMVCTLGSKPHCMSISFSQTNAL